MKRYGDRDPIELDKAGNFYIRHVHAMTNEGLHAKSDIAAELAYRDWLLHRCYWALLAHNQSDFRSGQIMTTPPDLMGKLAPFYVR